MTLLTIILSISSTFFLSLVIFLIWYIISAVRQIKIAEQYAYDLIEGIEELKTRMQDYISHVEQVNQMEMFYGDETLRELIRHGASLIETFEDYKVDYFPILELEEELNYDNESEQFIEESTP